MAGTKNGTLVGKNADFTQDDGPNSQSSEANGLATNGQLWIGTTAVNAGGTHINVGTLASSDGSVTIGYSSPNINLVAGASVPTTFTADSGSATPALNNLNVLGSGSTTTVASGSTVTTQLTGLTNHTVLVGAGTTTITKVGPGTAGQVLQSGGASADPAYSTPTYPSTSGSVGKIIRSDGTNNLYSTATYPDTAGTSGNVLTSDGTNWISSAPSGSGISNTTNYGFEDFISQQNGGTAGASTWTYGGQQTTGMATNSSLIEAGHPGIAGWTTTGVGGVEIYPNLFVGDGGYTIEFLVRVPATGATNAFVGTSVPSGFMAGTEPTFGADLMSSPVCLDAYLFDLA